MDRMVGVSISRMQVLEISLIRYDMSQAFNLAMNQGFCCS